MLVILTWVGIDLVQIATKTIPSGALIPSSSSSAEPAIIECGTVRHTKNAIFQIICRELAKLLTKLSGATITRMLSIACQPLTALLCICGCNEYVCDCGCGRIHDTLETACRPFLEDWLQHLVFHYQIHARFLAHFVYLHSKQDISTQMQAKQQANQLQ